MTKKVITLTYTFDRLGNPENIALEIDGDNVLLEDDSYLKQLVKCLDSQNSSTDNDAKPCHGLKLVKN